MKENINLTFRDNIIKLSLIVSTFLLIAIGVLLFLFYNRLPPSIPFFNSMPWGTDRLGSPQLLFLLPGLSFLVLLINNLLSIKLYEEYTLIARILSVNALLFIGFSLLAFIQILLLVF